MAQTTLLAAGQTAANSSDTAVTMPCVAALFTSDGTPPPKEVTIGLVQVLPNGSTSVIGGLNYLQDGGKLVIDANCTVRAVRTDISAYGKNVGVALDQ